MPSEITMPQLSDTMTEGTLVKWHKKEGDKVKAGDEVADVETDKATMPMEAFDSGVLAYVAVAEGQKVKVGQRIALIATEGEDPAQVRQQGAAATPTPPPAQEAAPEPPAAEAPPAPSPPAVPAPPSLAADERIRVSPLARRIAADKGIDLSALRGSGPSGRIVQKDVEAAMAHPRPTAPPGRARAVAAPTPLPASAAAPLIVPGETQRITLNKMRSAIAAALQRSKQQIPHFYETVGIDMEAVAQLRAWLNKALEAEGIKLSLADFIARALAIALGRHPDLNATFDGQTITRYGDVNLGIAVALPEGLLVPVLRQIHAMDLRTIRARTADLVERARKGRLKPDEMSGGTFTVTNLGQYGVRDFGAIINLPQVAILAVAAAEKRPAVRGDAIVPRLLMSATISADHRVVDGAVAAQFLQTLKSLLEEPGALVV